MFFKVLKKKKFKRVGRGESSGLGKTCGKGNKGQKSRSGFSKKISLNRTFFKNFPKFGFSVSNLKKNIFNFKLFNNIPFTFISPLILKKISFIKKNIFLLKLFSNFLIFKKIIFYNVFFLNYFIFFNLNFFFIF